MGIAVPAESNAGAETEGQVTVSGRFEYDPAEPDPFVSQVRQAQRDAFDARVRYIWWLLALVLVLIVSVVWLCFR
jgi:hypothetical protein